jgi:hypothetical protein
MTSLGTADISNPPKIIFPSEHHPEQAISVNPSLVPHKWMQDAEAAPTIQKCAHPNVPQL